jgi:hypothetical protein
MGNVDDHRHLSFTSFLISFPHQLLRGASHNELMRPCARAGLVDWLLPAISNCCLPRQTRFAAKTDQGASRLVSATLPSAFPFPAQQPFPYRRDRRETLLNNFKRLRGTRKRIKGLGKTYKSNYNNITLNKLAILPRGRDG